MSRNAKKGECQDDGWQPLVWISTDILRLKSRGWFLICDLWFVTCDLWLVICDLWSAVMWFFAGPSLWQSLASLGKHSSLLLTPINQKPNQSINQKPNQTLTSNHNDLLCICLRSSFEFCWKYLFTFDLYSVLYIFVNTFMFIYVYLFKFLYLYTIEDSIFTQSLPLFGQYLGQVSKEANCGSTSWPEL